MRLLSTLENAEKGDPLESILGPLDPIVPAQNGSYAQGPFVFTNERITNHLSAGQGVLDDKLSAELRKLMRSKYPRMARAFFFQLLIPRMPYSYRALKN